MIKINCAVCGKEIIHPNARQKTCSHKCSIAYQEASQKAYHKTDKWKAYWKAYQKTDKYKASRRACYQRKKAGVKE